MGFLNNLKSRTNKATKHPKVKPCQRILSNCTTFIDLSSPGLQFHSSRSGYPLYRSVRLQTFFHANPHDITPCSTWPNVPRCVPYMSVYLTPHYTTHCDITCCQRSRHPLLIMTLTLLILMPPNLNLRRTNLSPAPLPQEASTSLRPLCPTLKVMSSSSVLGFRC